MAEYTIKDIPRDERPRERLIKYGASSLSNAELLAIILRTGVKGENVLTLAGNLLSKYDLKKLSKADVSELRKIKGISDAKACQIAACFELGRRASVYRGEEKPRIRSPEEAYSVVSDLSSEPQEVFAVLLLDIKNRVIKREKLFRGGRASSLVEPQEIFRRALLESASRIILVHNHPSGDPEPSSEDINITKRVKEAGELVGIDVLDHIIVGDSGYVSLKERGLI